MYQAQVEGVVRRRRGKRAGWVEKSHPTDGWQHSRGPKKKETKKSGQKRIPRLVPNARLKSRRKNGKRSWKRGARSRLSSGTET